LDAAAPQFVLQGPSGAFNKPRDLPIPVAPTPALGWLERLYELTPDTVVLHVEVSGVLVLLVLAILLLRLPWR
jgi:hypothetical protein